MGQFRLPTRSGSPPYILPPLPQSITTALQRYRGLVYDEFKRHRHFIIYYARSCIKGQFNFAGLLYHIGDGAAVGRRSGGNGPGTGISE